MYVDTLNVVSPLPPLPASHVDIAVMCVPSHSAQSHSIPPTDSVTLTPMQPISQDKGTLYNNVLHAHSITFVLITVQKGMSQSIHVAMPGMS